MEKLYNLRLQLFQAGLIRLALDVHIVHGLDLRFSLLPARRNQLSLSTGSFFEPDDVLKVYGMLKANSLSLEELDTEVRSESIPANSGYSAASLEAEMSELAARVPASDRPEELLDDPANSQTCERVSRLLWNVCYGLESASLTVHFPRNELELIAYLALVPHGQSKEMIYSELFAEDQVTSERRAFDTRLSRTRSTLSELLEGYRQVCFYLDYEPVGESQGASEQASGSDDNYTSGSQALDNDAVNETKRISGQQRVDFFEEDGFGKIRLKPGLVRVDDWELQELLAAAGQERSRNLRLYVQKIRQVFNWIASTMQSHGDRENGTLITESLIRPLGTFGDRCQWEILERKRNKMLDLWYNANLYLGNYYRSKNPALSFQHYTQAHAVYPAYEDPVISLMQISHNQGDLGAVRQIFKNYKNHCQRDGFSISQTVINSYQNYTGDEVKEKRRATNKTEPGQSSSKSA